MSFSTPRRLRLPPIRRAGRPVVLVLVLLPALLSTSAGAGCTGGGAASRTGDGRLGEGGAAAEASPPAEDGSPAAPGGAGTASSTTGSPPPVEPPDVEEWWRSLSSFDAGVVRVLYAAGPPGREVDGGAGGAATGSGGEAGARRLGTELAAVAEAMAAHLPLPLEALRSLPLTVAVEADHPAQILHAGAVGEAIPGGPADVHLVFHPDDGFAYRHALALALLRRAGLGEELPPYVRSGAAWWLVESAGVPGAEGGARGGELGGAGELRWYGRARSDWLRRLAAGDVLPTAGELLAGEEPPDGSRLLWTPVAAAVVAELPGATLAEKLAVAGDGTLGTPLRAATDRLLGGLAGAPPPDDPPPSPDSAGVPAPNDALPPFLAGVSLAMLNDVHLGYQAPSVDVALAHLRRAVAANAVSLMPFAYQRRPDDPRLVYLNRRPRSETDAAMLHAGRRARERGLTVLWKPQIWLSGSWPGEVEMRSEAEWTAWFRSYRRFLVHQAVLADRVGAELYSVGVELGRTVDRRDDWERAIDAVQLFFGGPLTYAANWYGDFDRVSFWARLDYLGMDAYHPLTEDPAADDGALAAGARRVVRELEAAVRKADPDGTKPLILTEVGFAAHRTAWVAPHEEGGPYSPRDQARAYRALLGALGHPPWLRGVFVWKAFSSGPRSSARGGELGERSEDFADFRFLGRPAEDVVRGYYRRAGAGRGGNKASSGPVDP